MGAATGVRNRLRDSLREFRRPLVDINEDGFLHPLFLQRYIAWPPSPLEVAESLEQLRILWHGEGIHVGIAVAEPGPGVDTPEDMKRVTELVGRGC